MLKKATVLTHVPLFIWAVRLCNRSWRTEKPFQRVRPPKIFYSRWASERCENEAWE